MLDPMLALMVALALSLLFLLAGWHKFRRPWLFRQQLAAYRLLPENTLPLLSRLIPVAELAVVPGLLMPPLRAAAGVAAACLLLLYAGAMAVNLLRGRGRLDCGCGSEPEPVSWFLVLRNVVFAGAAVTLALPVVARHLAFIEVALALLLSLLLSGVVAAAGQLHRNGVALHPGTQS